MKLCYFMHVACMGDRRVSFGLLVEKPAGKEPLGKTRHRLTDNIKVHLNTLRTGDADLHF